MRALVALALALGVSSLDDGLAISPPMGWRSWNQFGILINQSLIEAQYEALADRSRLVDGVPTSLLDIGYEHAAIDDGWQLCNAGPGGVGFHNESGYPLVNASLFPDMAAMTAKARSLGVKSGWYENGGHCPDYKYGTYEGVVNATRNFGFEGIKMDRAGRMKSAKTLASSFNASGVRVLQENNEAKAGRDASGNVVCNMHFFRTGLDIRPTYGSVLKGMNSVRKFNEGGLTGPGCWAHADMLALGVTSPQPPGAKHHCETATNPCFLNVSEMRSNFGAWCIISSPLILALDLRDSKMLDLAWPIITNREAIAVNQQWSGDSGRLHRESNISVNIPNCGNGRSCMRPQWMVWSKALPPAADAKSRAAIFLMNSDSKAINVSTVFADIYGLGPCGDAGCSVRSIWDRRDLGPSLEVSFRLAPHDSAFLLVSSPAPVPGPTPLPATSTPKPVGPCIQPNTLYDSHKTGNRLLDGHSRQASDATACQELCSKTEGCVCFSHRKSLGHCWLMAQCQVPEQSEFYDSGTAVCFSEEALQI